MVDFFRPDLSAPNRYCKFVERILVAVFVRARVVVDSTLLTLWPRWISVPVRINIADRIVSDISVKVQRLGIAKYGIRHGGGLGRPVGCHETAQVACEVA